MNQISLVKEGIETKNPVNARLDAGLGLTEEVVRLISQEKHEPQWMLDKRLQGLKAFQKTSLPHWGPSLKTLDLTSIRYYMDPRAPKNTRSWDDVPDDIKQTFEKLGIPEAERTVLAGAGTQYESSVVYHNLKKEWEEKGVIFLDMDEAVKHHPDIVREYFMSHCVPITDHKFSMLHAAVWSGGTFIYVPAGVQLTAPLQAYFRMNAEKGGQFEHTLIIAEKGAEVHYVEGCSAPQYTSSSLHAGCVEIYVKEGARVRYSSIENWSKNTYNLNTKRAVVEKDGIIEWVNGNMGSSVTMLYPSSVLKGEGARSDYLGIAYAGAGQHQDTGSKVFHLAPRTTSTIRVKSISRDGGISSYRGHLQIVKGATGCKATVQCDALMMDARSKSNTYPTIKVNEQEVDVAHEATVGKISADQLFYLMNRGLSEEQAMQMIVSGFIEPVVRELPLEYAVELNRLIQLEMEKSLG